MQLRFDRHSGLTTCNLTWSLELGDVLFDFKAQAFLRLCDQYFHQHVNPELFALFQRHKPALDERSTFTRSGCRGAWWFCPNELAAQVEGVLRYAYSTIEEELQKQLV